MRTSWPKSLQHQAPSQWNNSVQTANGKTIKSYFDHNMAIIFQCLGHICSPDNGFHYYTEGIKKQRKSLNRFDFDNSSQCNSDTQHDCGTYS
jgi:hypothetical protein